MSSYRKVISKGGKHGHRVKEIKVQKQKPRGDIERSSVIWISFHSPVRTWIYCGCYQIPLRVELKSSYTVLPKKPPSSWPPSLLSQGERKSEPIYGICTAKRISWPSLSKKMWQSVLEFTCLFLRASGTTPPENLPSAHWEKSHFQLN